MKLFHVPQELSNLIWLGLAGDALHVYRTRDLRMFEDVMASIYPIQPVAKRLNDTAEILKPHVMRAGQKFLVYALSFHPD